MKLYTLTEVNLVKIQKPENNQHTLVIRQIILNEDKTKGSKTIQHYIKIFSKGPDLTMEPLLDETLIAESEKTFSIKNMIPHFTPVNLL